MIPDTLTRTQRTGVQVGGSTALILVLNYVLGLFGVSVPEEVLLAGLGLLTYYGSILMNFAEDQGWIKDRRAV
jgi:hypothetical protein